LPYTKSEVASFTFSKDRTRPKKFKTGSRGYADDMINLRTKFEDSSVTHSKVKQDDPTLYK